jgi:hypothetical protein
MLRCQNSLIQTFTRFNSNFVKAAGLFERTSSQDYAKRPFLIQDQSKQLTYDQFNNRVGQYASLLSSKYKLQVGLILKV